MCVVCYVVCNCEGSFRLVFHAVMLCMCAEHTQNEVLTATASFMMERKKWTLKVCMNVAYCIVSLAFNL